MHTVPALQFSSIAEFWRLSPKMIDCGICHAAGNQFIKASENNRQLFIIGECTSCHKPRKILNEAGTIAGLEFIDYIINANQKFYAREVCTLVGCAEQYMSNLSALVAVEYKCSGHNFIVEYSINQGKPSASVMPQPILAPPVKRPPPSPPPVKIPAKRGRPPKLPQLSQPPKPPKPTKLIMSVRMEDYLAKPPATFPLNGSSYTKEALIVAINTKKIAWDLTCPFECGALPRSRGADRFDTHLEIHLAPSANQCRWCGLSFRKIGDVLSHQAVFCIHKPPNWQAEIDPRGNPAPIFQYHRCRICQLYFSPQDVAPHWFWYHPEHSQKCFFEGCTYNLTSPIRLLNHLASCYHNLPRIILGDEKDEASEG